MRRYLVVFAITLVAAAVLSVVARQPRSEPAGVVLSKPEAASEIALAIEHGRTDPAAVWVLKDRPVRVTIENRDSRPVAFALAGYEDRVSNPALAPGERWVVTFVADRPGDDFAWLVDGRPAGRFAVQGSHLVEGHR